MYIKIVVNNSIVIIKILGDMCIIDIKYELKLIILIRQ